MAYDPKVLLKIAWLAYPKGLISSWRIEQACRENVTFIALASRCHLGQEEAQGQGLRAVGFPA